MTTSSDLTQGAGADAVLTSAVADRLRRGRFAPSEYLDSIAEGNWCVRAAEAALTAAGRVLAERLRAEADGHADEVQRVTSGAGASALTPGLLLGANLVVRWCGTEPESDGAPSGGT